MWTSMGIVAVGVVVGEAVDHIAETTTETDTETETETETVTETETETGIVGDAAVFVVEIERGIETQLGTRVDSMLPIWHLSIGEIP
jgi:hypothetical protein